MFFKSHSWFVCLSKMNLVSKNPQLKVSFFCFILKLKATKKIVAVINSFVVFLSLFLEFMHNSVVICRFAFAFSCWKSFIFSLVYCAMLF